MKTPELKSIPDRVNELIDRAVADIRKQAKIPTNRGIKQVLKKYGRKAKRSAAKEEFTGMDDVQKDLARSACHKCHEWFMNHEERNNHKKECKPDRKKGYK